MVHRQVVAQVDQVQTTVIGSGQEVGVLNQCQEGHVAIVDVEPVHAGHERPIEAEDEHVRAVVLGPRVALDEVRRKIWREAGEQPGRKRGQQLIEHVDLARVGVHFRRAVAPDDARRTGTGEYRAPERPNALAECLVEQLKTPTQVAESQ